MRFRKKIPRKKSKKSFQHWIHKLQITVFSVELLLLTGVLFLIMQQVQGKHAVLSGVDFFDSDITELPKDVELSILQSTPSAALRIPIFMYHYVEYVQDKKDTFRVSLNIEPHIFAEQIKTLLADGYTFITAKELGEILESRLALPEKPVLLTFDDGHWDVLTDILPILKKYKVKGTVYIIPGFIGSPDFLSENQLREVIHSGFFDIGAHSLNHLTLPELSAAVIHNEIRGSKEQLEQKYGINVASFAYPFGAFSVQTIEEVKKNNFSVAVSTIPGIEQSQTNRYFLYRLRPGRRVGEELLYWLQQNTFSAFGN